MPDQPEELSDLLAQAIAETESNPQEDTPELNVLSQALLDYDLDTDKVPLERAAHLLAAREAAAAVRLDQISLEEYLQKLIPIQDTADNGIKLFATEAVQKEMDKLPPEQLQLVEGMEEQVHVLKEGIELMVAYAESGLIDDLDRGLELVERSMRAVDALQDLAAEIGARCKAEREAAEAEGRDQAGPPDAEP